MNQRIERLIKILWIFIIGGMFHSLAQPINLIPEQSDRVQKEDHFDIHSALQDPSYIRHRFVNMNLSTVRSLPIKESFEESTMDQAQDEPVLWNLEVFPGIEFQMQVESSRSTQFNGSFIQAKIINGGEGFMTLMLGENGVVRGEVHSSEGVFTISNGGSLSDRVLIQEVNTPPHWTQRDDTIDVELPSDFIPSGKTEESSSLYEVFHAESFEDKIFAQSSNKEDRFIDILALYTQSAREAQTGSTDTEKIQAIENNIYHEIEKTNQALLNSGAEVRVRLVGMEEIPTTDYTQGRCMNEDLDSLRYTSEDLDSDNNSRDPEGKLDHIHKMRKQYAADFVHLFVSPSSECPGACGIAYTLVTKATDNATAIDSAARLYNEIQRVEHNWDRVSFPNNQSLLDWWQENSSFSVSSIQGSCPTQYTFTHELGHNMGLFHDRHNVFDEEDQPADQKFPLYPYSFGYTDQSRLSSNPCEHTIMSYDGQCVDEGGTATRRPIFSNPNKNFSGNNSGENASGKAGENFTPIIDGPANAIQTMLHADYSLQRLHRRVDACINAIRIEGKSLPYHRTQDVDSEGEELTLNLSPEYCDTDLTAYVPPTIASNTVSFDPSENAFAENSFSTATTTLMLIARDTAVQGDSNSMNPDVINVKVSENITPCPRTGAIDLRGLGLEENNQDILIRQEAGQPVRHFIYQLHDQEEVSSCSRRITSAEIQTITEVPLSNKKIESITASDFTGLTEAKSVDLSQNSIDDLTERVFAGPSDYQGLIKVEKLNLSYNEIDTIHNSAFAGLNQIKELILSQNALTSLGTAISNLDSLTTLDVSHNSITSLPDLPNSLVRLNFSYNKISSLGSKIESLPNIQYLWFSHNDLSVLPAQLTTISSNPLRTVALDNNDIARFPTDFFQNLNRVRYLWLNDNDLNNLPRQSFNLDELGRLRYLNISGNNFTSSTTLHSDVCEVIQNVRHLITDSGVTKNTLCPPSSVSTSHKGLFFGVTQFLSALFDSSPDNQFYNELSQEEMYGDAQKEVVLKMFREDHLSSDLISEITGVPIHVVDFILQESLQ